MAHFVESVIVVYDPNKNTQSILNERNIRVAGYAPWKLGEMDTMSTFRIGLFGKNRLDNISNFISQFNDKLPYNVLS